MLLHSADLPRISCKPSYKIASNCIVMCSAKYQPGLSLPMYFFWGSVSTQKFNGGGRWAHKAQIFDTIVSGVWIVNPKFRLLKHLGTARERLWFCSDILKSECIPSQASSQCWLSQYSTKIGIPFAIASGPVPSAGAQSAAGALLWRQPTIINTPFSFTSSSPLPHGA